MLNSDMTVDHAAHSSVSRLCKEFVRKSDATCALLVGQDGMLLHRCGSVRDLDVDSLSALSAGAFATGREMAALIGETTFDVAMQQGDRNHLQMIRVGGHALLVIVFDDRSTAAMVRLHGQRAAQRLARALSAEGPDAERASADALGEDGEPRLGPTGFIAQTQARVEQLRGALRIRTAAFVLALLAAAVAVLGAILRH